MIFDAFLSSGCSIALFLACRKRITLSRTITIRGPSHHSQALTYLFASSSMAMKSDIGVGIECFLPSLDTAPAKYLFSVGLPASTS